VRTHRLTPYGFLLPTLVFLGLVFGYAVVAVVLDSFRVPGILGVTNWGVTNYHAVLHDGLFWQSLRDNLELFLVIPVMTIVGLVMAVLLYERTSGWRIYRSLAFLPYVLAVPVVGVVFSYILERDGVLNQLLNALHLSFLAHDWLGSPGLALWSIAFIIAWQQTGLAIVLFLARLASVDDRLYEAAMVDCANWFQRFWHITLPQLGVQLHLRDDRGRATTEDVRHRALHLRGRVPQRPQQPGVRSQRAPAPGRHHRAVRAGGRSQGGGPH
jgi:ABC-type sugar transport system permease subunit